MERKNINNENQQIKLQRAPSKVNITKPSGSVSPSPQKRMIKIDLKLQYLLNELNSTRKFKDFLEDLNMTAKNVIKNTNQNQQNYEERDKNEKKKNSFNLLYYPKLGKESQTNEQKQRKQSKSQTKQEKTKQSEFLSLSQQINPEELQQMLEMISNKKNQLLNHIQLIKKRIGNSSIWDDKYFYDFTESNYQQKMQEMQEKLKITETNLQGKQKQRKQSNINPNNQIVRVKSIKYSLYDQKSEQGSIADQNFEVKRKIINLIKTIKRLQGKLSSILQQKEISQKSLSKQSNKPEHSIHVQDQEKNNDHPFIIAIKKLTIDLKKISRQISIKTKLKQSNKNLKSNSQSMQEKNEISSKIIQIFNRNILQQQLLKTRDKIGELKQQTSNLQNGIKQLQGYKALIMLRNKQCDNIEMNSKKLQSVEKITFNDQILRQILQHQFLNKSLNLKIQTKFCGLKKKDQKSFSKTDLKPKMNYFPNINQLKKSVSQKKIKSHQFINGIHLKDYQAKSSQKKSKKLQVTSSKSSKKKEAGSSTETNP